MGLLVDSIGNKAPGNLITAADWNTLVAAVEAVETGLTQQINTVQATLSARIETLETRFNQLQTSLNALQAVVTPLLSQYRRVALSTTRVNYAIGELAEITVQVTDLQGRPVTFANDQRPWIDLVTTWGQFKPVGGFESLGGVGDRTISVRTNAQGLARVQLRSDYAEGLADEDENEMAAALNFRFNGSLTIAQAILAANTPQEAASAYQAMHRFYDGTQPTISSPTRVRTYLDTHYLRNPALAVGKLIPFYRLRWRDYRATVMAFAKPDSDPLTPDTSLGVSSIQVTYRDWIGPWIIDYIDPPRKGDLVGTIRDRLRPRIDRNYLDSITRVKLEVQDIVRNQGLVGKQRDYGLVREAMISLNTDSNPIFFNSLVSAVQDAVTMQQTLEAVQVGTANLPSQTVAFEVFTNAATRADTSAATAQAQLDQSLTQRLTQQVQQVRTELRQEQLAFQNNLVADNGVLRNTVNAQIAPLRQQVIALQQLGDPTVVRNSLNEVAAIKDRVNNLQAIIQRR